MNLETKVLKWAIDRNIMGESCTRDQVLKLGEEYGELCSAEIKDDLLGVYDAIGDMLVVLTIIADMEGTSLEECMQGAYDTIKHRTGKMVEGVYVKD